MNLLSLIFVFLSIFSLLIGSWMATQSTVMELDLSYLGHLRATQVILDQVEVKNFRRLRKKESKPLKKQGLGNERRNKRQYSYRAPECGKLNLFAWVHTQGGERCPPMLIHHLQTLYGQELFQNKGVDGVRFTHLFWEVLQLHDPDQEGKPLEELVFPSLEDQRIYYSMLKGKKGNYPSLLLHFTWKKKGEAFCLRHAGEEQLTFVLGEKIADWIVKSREEKMDLAPFLVRFKELCLEERVDPDLPPLCSMKSHAWDRQEWFEGQDRKTKLKLKKKLSAL